MAIPVVVISLELSADRRAYIAEHLSALAIPFRFLNAVDGTSLVIGNETRNLKFRNHPRSMGPREIACCLSHRMAWQSIADSHQPWGLVLEDDARISPGLPNLLRDLSWVPPNADIIHLEASAPSLTHLSIFYRSVLGRRVHKLRGDLTCAAAYLVSRTACLRLLSLDIDCRFPVDRWLFDRRSEVGQSIVTYLMDPAPCIQNPAFASLIEQDRMDLRTHWRARHQDGLSAPVSLSQKIAREVKRVGADWRLLLSRRRAIGWN